MKPLKIRTHCPCCNADIGEKHMPGCSVERCPFCGGQIISCPCAYKHFSIDIETMEEKHPGIFKNGLPSELSEEYEAYLAPHLLLWDGTYPGDRECREYGFWVKWTANGWQPCDADDPEATEDLNTLAWLGQWDKEKKRYIVPTHRK